MIELPSSGISIDDSHRPDDPPSATHISPAAVTSFTPLDSSDAALLQALRRRDEDAFLALVDRHSAAMMRIAMIYVRDAAHAEEVVQEAWLGVLRGLDSFAGLSSLKTWIFRILRNCAIDRARRERRVIPFTDLGDQIVEQVPSVPGSAFHAAGHPHAGHFARPVPDWMRPAEDRVIEAETRERIQAAIDRLPARQREVLELRDVHGWSSEEVCEVLELSEGNQRVLLHRARSAIRRELEEYLSHG